MDVLAVAIALIVAVTGLAVFRLSHALRGTPGLPMGSRWVWPLVGETFAYLRPHKSNTVGEFLQQHCSRYGRVFRSHLFGRPTIVSCDLDLNTFVLQNEGRLFRSSYPKPLHDILGELSLMHVSGDTHKKLRSVAVSFINASKSRPDFVSWLENLCIGFTDSLKGKNQVHFFEEAKKITFYLMVKSMMSMEPQDPLAAKLSRDYSTFMKGFVSLPVSVPGTAYSKAIKARRRISFTVKDIIRRRENVQDEAHRERDFLDELLAKHCLNDEEKVSIVLDLLLAGHETTSGLMALVVYFLARAPSVLQKLQDEHKVLIRKRSLEYGKPLGWEDYKKLEFTNQVINETLRCGNLVKFVHRKALKDVKFKECVIPSGWQVLPILSATHLDPNLHENPMEFNPWRWEDTTTSRKVTPFGGGLRVCPGAELGKVETAIFLHYFILNFRWKIGHDECPLSCPYLEFKRGLLLDVEHIQE